MVKVLINLLWVKKFFVIFALWYVSKGVWLVFHFDSQFVDLSVFALCILKLC